MSRLDSLTPASSPVRVTPSMSHRFPLAPFPARSIVSRWLPLGSTATLAALPAMSLIPSAPFPYSRRVLCPPRRSLGVGGSLLPLTPLSKRCKSSSRQLSRAESPNEPSLIAAWQRPPTSFSGPPWRLRPVALSSEPRCWLSPFAVPCASDSLSEICHP